MTSLDAFIQNYFLYSRTPQVTELFFALTTIFDFTVYFILIVAGLSFLINKTRGGRYSVLFVFSIVASGLVVYLLKEVFSTARPPDGFMHAFGSSFPSYHATISTVFFVLLMYIFDDYLSKFSRVVFNTFSIVTLFLVALLRVYLVVYWVSDVVFGVILGATLSYVFVSVFRSRNTAL